MAGRYKKNWCQDRVVNYVRTYHKRNILLVLIAFFIVILILVGRLGYLMIGRSEHFGVKAKEIQEREDRKSVV